MIIRGDMMSREPLYPWARLLFLYASSYWVFPSEVFATNCLSGFGGCVT